MRESLRRLEGYQIQDVRDQEMLAPISERVFTPLLEGLTGVARRFTPAGFGEGIANKLVLAGSPANLNVDKVLVMKLLGIVSVIVWAPLVLVLQLPGVHGHRRDRVLGARRSCTPTCSSTARSTTARRRSRGSCPTSSTCS